MATIVLGYDGSGCARCALKAALDLCKTLGDRLVIAYAFEPPGKMVGEEFKEHRQALEEIGDDMTREAIEHARAEGVQAHVELVAERPAEALRRLGDAVRRANDRRRDPG